MAEPLEPTADRLAFLADVRDRNVLTNASDNQVYLEAFDPPTQVSDMAELCADAGWVREPADSVVWQLTERGRAVLEWSWS